MNDDELVEYRHGHVMRLRLNSPSTRNALGARILASLAEAVRAAVDESGVRVIIIDHAPPAFSSGLNLNEGPSNADLFAELLLLLQRCPKPVVALVDGAARGGAVGLAAAADISIATSRASFAFPEVQFGSVPAIVAAVVAPRIHPAVAQELLLTGRVMSGAEAAQVGLVTRHVARECLGAAERDVIEGLLRGAPRALARTKQFLVDIAAPEAVQPLDALLADAVAVSRAASDSAEGREGALARREKRAAAWAVSYMPSAAGLDTRRGGPLDT